MDKTTWNPIFYVAFIPILLGALYMVICVIGGICSKEARQAAAKQKELQRQQQAEVADKAEARKRPLRTGPSFRRGKRAAEPHYLT